MTKKKSKHKDGKKMNIWNCKASDLQVSKKGSNGHGTVSNGK